MWRQSPCASRYDCIAASHESQVLAPSRRGTRVWRVEDIVDDESIVDSLVKAFSEGFDNKERNVWILPQIYYGMYSIGSPSTHWAVTVHTTSGILNASRGSRRSTSPEHVFLLKLPVLQEGPRGVPRRSPLSTATFVSPRRSLCFFSFFHEVSSLVYT